MVDGQATFEIDGETVEAPAGTLLYVSPEARRKATGEATILAFGGIPGEAYQGLDWGEAWPFHTESMTAYGEQRYSDALQAVRGGLERVPDHAGLNYNYACFSTLAGETDDQTFQHLSVLSNRSRRSASRRAWMTTSPRSATIRGSKRLLADRTAPR